MGARTPGDPRTVRATPSAPLTVVHAGVVDYRTAWAWQRELAARRERDAGGDVVLLLEHPRVYTLGRRADEGNLVFDADERARRGIELHRIDRGGDVTYHGPGQLVGYPILRLDGPRVVDHVRALEELNLRVAAGYGVSGRRVDGFSGVWIPADAGAGRPEDAKLAAIGVHVSARAVTTHGWALNVTTDLTDFAGIVPCGIPDKPVTSLQALGVDATVPHVVRRTVDVLGELYEVAVHTATPADLGLQEVAA